MRGALTKAWTVQQREPSKVILPAVPRISTRTKIAPDSTAEGLYGSPFIRDTAISTLGRELHTNGRNSAEQTAKYPNQFLVTSSIGEMAAPLTLPSTLAME